MKKAAFIIVVLLLLHFTVAAQQGQDKKEVSLAVKIGEVNLKIETIEVTTGLELVNPDKKDSKGVRFDPRMFGLGSDSSGLSYIDWLNYGLNYIALKYTITNEGDGKPLYVSPTVRYDAVLKANSDAGKILSQARMFPDTRPKFCPTPAVFRLEKGKKVEDVFVIKAPVKEAKSVKVEVYMQSILPEVGGSLKFEVPMEQGKLGDLSKMKLDYEPKKQEEPKKVKRKGKAKFGKVAIELVDACSKNLNFLDEESGMVFTTPDAHTLITLKVTNKGSKPVNYNAVLLQDSIPGIAVDDQGKWCGMLSIVKKAKLLECYDLKKTIPAKGEVMDYVLLSASAGIQSLRLVLIADSLFTGMKAAKGVAMFMVKFKGNSVSEVRGGVMKKSITLKQKSLVKTLNQAEKVSKDVWDKKYAGLLVSGSGKVRGTQYYEQNDITLVVLDVLDVEDIMGTSTCYCYLLLLSGNVARYKAKDQVAFKAIVIGNSVTKSGWIEKNLIVYGVTHAQSHR